MSGPRSSRRHSLLLHTFPAYRPVRRPKAICGRPLLRAESSIVRAKTSATTRTPFEMNAPSARDLSIFRLPTTMASMAESQLHRQLKHVACRWLWGLGYAGIADEVEVPGVGIIDVAAAGKWKRYNPRRVDFERTPLVDRHHVAFVECKAMRSDFLRDQGRQQQFAFALEERARQLRAGRRRKPRHASPALGKFDTCLIRPHANVHYLLVAPHVLKIHEIPRRWGLLVFDGATVRVARKPAWQEVASIDGIEGAIARSLTARRMYAWANAEVSAARAVEAPQFPTISSV